MMRFIYDIYIVWQSSGKGLYLNTSRFLPQWSESAGYQKTSSSLCIFLCGVTFERVSGRDAWAGIAAAFAGGRACPNTAVAVNSIYIVTELISLLKKLDGIKGFFLILIIISLLWINKNHGDDNNVQTEAKYSSGYGRH